MLKIFGFGLIMLIATSMIDILTNKKVQYKSNIFQSLGIMVLLVLDTYYFEVTFWFYMIGCTIILMTNEILVKRGQNDE